MNRTTLLSVESVVVRSGQLIEAEVQGEVVALDVDRDQCYGLDKVAARIWRMIVAPSRVGDVCNRLAHEYDVEESRCAHEVLALLEDLRGEGLVAVVDPDSGA
jgi:hypothetical protein